MGLTLVTPPAVEPVSLLELKEHLRLESGSLEEDLSAEISIPPGSHPIIPAYGLEGAGVEVLSVRALVLLEAGECGSGGTVDVKLQDSDDGIVYADVSGGAFSQVSEANDLTVYSKYYGAGRRYVRGAATVAGAACEFSVTVVKNAPQGTEDLLLAAFITAAREYGEGFQNRAFITQSWELSFDRFPESPFQVPFAPLQSVESITCYDAADAPHVIDPGDYQVDTGGFVGRVALRSGKSWPAVSLRPLSGVVIGFTAGYGDAGSDVPEKTRLAIKLLAGHLYENREASDTREHYTMPMAVDSLLGLERIVPV